MARLLSLLVLVALVASLASPTSSSGPWAGTSRPVEEAAPSWLEADLEEPRALREEVDPEDEDELSSEGGPPQTATATACVRGRASEPLSLRRGIARSRDPPRLARRVC